MFAFQKFRTYNIRIFNGLERAILTNISTHLTRCLNCRRLNRLLLGKYYHFHDKWGDHKILFCLVKFLYFKTSMGIFNGHLLVQVGQGVRRRDCECFVRSVGDRNLAGHLLEPNSSLTQMSLIDYVILSGPSHCTALARRSNFKLECPPAKLSTASSCFHHQMLIK